MNLSARVKGKSVNEKDGWMENIIDCYLERGMFVSNKSVREEV